MSDSNHAVDAHSQPVDPVAAQPELVVDAAQPETAPVVEPASFDPTTLAPPRAFTEARPVSVANSDVVPAGLSTPLPYHNDLAPPRAGFLATQTPRESAYENYAASTNSRYGSQALLPVVSKEEGPSAPVPNLADESKGYGEPVDGKSSKRRTMIIAAAVIALVALVLIVILPVYFAVIKPKHTSGKTGSSSGGGSSSGSGTSTAGSASPSATPGAITGGDGSTITLANGTTFTYVNKFGGTWYYDPSDPFNNNAKVNSWTPALSESWTWGKDKVFGVNLGGWFVLEPFIVPALFQRYPNAKDEWHLSLAMAADTANGGMQQLEDHYATFITEEDFAQMAGAGLNWIRLPIPFWAIEVWPGEPFMERTCWKYILQALGWARKYGIRVKLDLHTIPGSQNGLNHSGRSGEINFLNGVMGVANAQRALNYIRIISEFISQPEYQPLVQIFGIMNEAYVSTIGKDALTRFYLQVHDMLRGITGFGEGKGAYMSIHDGFQGVATWANFLPGSDRIILDTHPYIAFNGQPNTAPVDTGTTWVDYVCRWSSLLTTSQTAFGVTVAGEWSGAINDCGLYVRGVGGPTVYGGNCADWMDASQWSPATITGLLAVTSATMDALQNWFFWTWKIGESNKGIVESPFWSYKLGLQMGFIPTDPRTAAGKCNAGAAFDGSYSAWQTGGAGAGTISADALASFSQYPPPTISNAGDVALLPTYTSTAAILTLPPPDATGSAKVDGWYDASDTGLGVTTVAGCTYPADAWSAVQAPMPTAVCTGTKAAAARAFGVTPTPPPLR